MQALKSHSRIIKFAIFFGVVVGFLAVGIQSVSAATYYVDKNNTGCSDSFTTAQNSLSSPWCTIGRANSAHSAGDTVYILPGEYREQMVPKAGLSNTQRTVYSGYSSDRTATKILGSELVTNWQPYSGNIFRASFNAGNQCRYSGGTITVRNTNCWIDRSVWLNRGAQNSAGDSLSDLNAPGEFFYDQNTSQLYVWMPQSDSPANHQIECSVRDGIKAGQYTSTPEIHNFTLQNLTIMQSNGGFRVTPNSGRPGNITIQNNEFAFTTGDGYCAGNPAAIYHGNSNNYSPDIPNIKILNNKIHDIGSDRGGTSDPSIGNVHAGAGIEFYTVKEALIEGNEIYNTFGPIGIKRGNSNITIRGNIIHDSGEGIWIGSPNLDGTTNTTTTATIVGNLIYNIQGAGHQAGFYTTGGNTWVNVYNNSFYNMNGIRIGTDNNSDSSYRKDNVRIDLKNNIFSELWARYEMSDLRYYIFRWNSILTSDSDYNIFNSTINQAAYFGGTWVGGTYGSFISSILYPNILEWRLGTMNDENSLVVNPLFVNPASANFALQSGSPAIDKGTIIPGFHCTSSGGTSPAGCRQWFGTAPDLGAFESTASGPTGDTNPPSVSITGPSNNSTVSGSVGISANASDNIAVIGVQFKVDGVNIGSEDTSAPYSATWNSTGVSNGAHTITATARDAAGNQTPSIGIVVTVSNGTTPTNGTLSATHNAPANNFQIANGNSFSYSVTLNCSGGSCGNVTATLDPTFGNINQGSGWDNASANNLLLSKYVAPESGTITSMTAYTGASTGQLKYVIYSNSNQLLAQSASFTPSGVGWKTQPISLQVTAGQTYWLGWFQQSGAMYGAFSTGSSGQGTYISSGTTFPTLPSTLPSSGNVARNFSVYATYTATGGSTATPKGTVPMNSGSPFYTTSQNPQTCSNMVSGSACNLTWNVVANGASAPYNFFVSFASNNSSVASINSPTTNISINSNTTTPPDTTAPVISNIGVNSITTNSAIIAWATNENSDTQIQYGLTTSYGSQTTLNTTPTTAHLQTLTGLTPGLVYHFRVLSSDSAGNLAQSPDNTFMVSSNPPPANSTIQNGGFESCTANDTLPTGWGVAAVSSGGGACTNSTLVAPPYSGTWRTYVVGNSYLYQPITLTAGTTYTFSAYAMNVAASNPSTLLISSQPGGGTTYCTNATTATTWTRIFCTYTPSTNSTVYLNLIGGPNDPGSRFDEVTLTSSTPIPGDTTNPTGSISAPISGSTISGSNVTLSATATDNVGVAGVQFRVDGVNIGSEDTTLPYSTTWDSTTTSNGPHTITAVVRDTAGNTGTTAGVSVTVNNVVSGQFQIGDRVQVTATLNVRATANGTVLGQQQIGAQGTITGGPQSVAGFTWYQINYDSAPDGWSADLYLTSAPTTTPGDTQNPTVSISNPTSGSIVSGSSVALSANASDNIAVAGVQFRIDGINIGTEDAIAPYSTTWDSTGVINGTHTITAVARDATGNSATATGVVVTVSNGTIPTPDVANPIVSVTIPVNNTVVSGSSVALSANASDNVGVVGVQFRIDGINVGVEDTIAPYSITWDSTGVANGIHQITASARDAAGNSATTSNVSVTVNNVAIPTPDTTNPIVSITNPLNNAIVSGANLSISANATDNIGVSGVQFKLNGSNLGPEDTVFPYSIIWDSTAIQNGIYLLSATARDASGNTATSANISITVNNIVPDNTNPTVSITTPTSGSTVSGASVALSANASDNIAVVGVQFRVDGVNVGTEDTTTPYSTVWDSTTATNNTHNITAVARDAAGNIGTSPQRTVTVSNSTTPTPTPTLTITLDATPNGGDGSVGGVALIASVGGTATGPITHTFYCDRQGANTNITTGYDLQVVTTSSIYIANNLCSYTSVGTFTPKVITSRDTAPVVEARTTVTVRPIIVPTNPPSNNGGGGGGGGGGSTGGPSGSTATPIPTSNPNTPVSTQNTTNLSVYQSSIIENTTTGPTTNLPKLAPLTAPLYPGINHPQVKVMQQMLNFLGSSLSKTGPGSPGNETTFYGNLTKEAIKQFQLKNGIIASATSPEGGLVGPKTRKALNDAYLAKYNETSSGSVPALIPSLPTDATALQNLINTLMAQVQALQNQLPKTGN